MFKLLKKFKNRQAASIGIIGGADGPTAVYVTRGSKKNDLCNNAAVSGICPCGKSIYELQEYIVSKYSAVSAELSEAYRNCIKADIIQTVYPHLLKQQLPELKEKPSRRDIKRYCGALDARRTEALGFTEKKFDIRLFSIYTENGTLNVAFETESEFLSVTYTVSHNSDDKNMRQITDDILLFYGVTENDIINKTPRFYAYADALTRRK